MGPVGWCSNTFSIELEIMDFVEFARKSTSFIYDSSIVFLKFDGNKISSTRKCWDELDSPLCTLPSASVGFVIFWEWVTSESQSLCCTASWSMAHANVVGQHWQRDLKSLNVGTDKLEELAYDRDKWRSSVYKSLKEREKKNL